MLNRLLIVALIFCALMLNAQEPATIHLTEKDGLPDIEFYNIIEDSKQFIWLAADKGLYRYDGQHYDYYSHPKQRGNAVFGTLEDHNGRIWCNNISGQFFYAKGKSLQLFIDLGDILNGELPQFKVTLTHLIVFTGRTIYMVSLDDKKITKVLKNQFSLVGSPLKINGNYFYTKRNQIIKTDSNFKKTDSLYLDIYNDKGNNRSISRYPNLVSNGTLFLCHFLRYDANVFFKVDIDKKQARALQVPKELKRRSINQIFFKDNEIWMATNLGIQIFKLNGDRLEFQKSLFNKINVTKIITDSDHNYWITTKGDGIFIIPNINIFQYKLPEDLMNINKIKNVNNNTILFGTNNGKVARFSIEKNRLKLLDSSSAHRVTEIILNTDNDEAIIVKEDVALSFNIQNSVLFKIEEELLYGAKSLSKAGDLGYVLSSYKDAFLFDKNFSEITKLVSKRSYTNYFSDSEKHIYVGTVEGLFMFDQDLNKFEIKYKSLPILAISITQTADNILWVSTFNNGIFGIKNNNVVANYNFNNGLLSNKTSVIQSDGNHLWITTEKGIQLLDVTNKTFKNLTKQNGIPSYRISDIEIIDNQVLFASNIGLFGLYKDKAFKTVEKKPVYFTDFTVNEISKNVKDAYKFNYDENKIGFSFNVNGFQSNINTRYQFRLLGLDKVWNTTNERINYVDYNSLPIGKYTFEVKALDGNDIESIQFSILKPYWKRWWFYLLIMAVIGVIIYSVFVSKIKKLKRKQAEILQKELLNKQLVFSQLENLRSQMNPHFIFNALNSIQEYIVLNEKDLASSYLIKFSRLIRIYLDHSRENEVLLSEEIKALKIYLELEKNRFEDLLDYKIVISEELKIQNIKIPSLFIQPYIENALKHGLLHKTKDRKLSVNFDINSSGDILICTIDDNGIGIEASRRINNYRQPQHKSFATSANKKRVSLLNTNRVYKIKVETINLSSVDTTGTRVIITIPF